ncbi:hypothetical protein ACH35V_40705 [Actinomadura sp. 1N219]|uniref:hypothetical protein n=1 Tax=Actinomadura sp. 1N219 TaxID=3375152 RepID=UPI0037A73750
MGASADEAADAATRSLNKLGDMLNRFNDVYEADEAETCDLAAEVLAQGLITAIYTLAAASRSHGFVLLPDSGGA